MMETRAGALERVARYGLFIGARTPCGRFVVPTLMNSAQKKRRNQRFGALWRSSQRRIESTGFGRLHKPVVARFFAPGAIDLNSDHPLRQHLNTRINTRR